MVAWIDTTYSRCNVIKRPSLQLRSTERQLYLLSFALLLLLLNPSNRLGDGPSHSHPLFMAEVSVRMKMARDRRHLCTQQAGWGVCARSKQGGVFEHAASRVRYLCTQQTGGVGHQARWSESQDFRCYESHEHLFKPWHLDDLRDQFWFCGMRN